MIVSMIFNVALATTVRDFLREHPQRHNQDRWITGQVAVLDRDPELAADIPALIRELEAAYRDDTCGTTGCFAGWASLFGGWRQLDEAIVYDPADFPPGATVGDVYESGRYTVMETAGRLALGLSDNQAAALFWHGNTIDAMLGRLLVDPFDELADIVTDHEYTDND